MKRDYPAIAEQYIAGVLDGSVLVCKTVRQAIERHKRDLLLGPERGLTFDPAAGAKVCKFFSILRPSKWPTPLELQPWQVAHMYILYGWKRADGTRRFRFVFDMWPRKTGKSAMVSGMGLYALAADDEMGAEVYSAALTEDQARRVFDEAVAMRDGTPQLRKKLTKAGNNPCHRLRDLKTAGIMKPLSRDKDTMEGLNVSFAGADELHKWRSRDTWDVIRYGMRSRRQPLMVGITTAPSAEDNSSLCNTLYNYAINVLEQNFEDDAFFTWITSLDPEDAWDDESKWIKACPNLGVTVKIEDMRQECLEAKNSPDSLNAFQRYSLNLRVDALEQPIATADWVACGRKGDPIELRQQSLIRFRGRICFAGLDLAITDDTSALVLVFPPMAPGEKWHFIPFCWIPAENIERRSDRDRVPYRLWRDQGFITATPGKTTDYEWIAARIMQLTKDYDVRELIYDPALASGLIKLLLTSGLPEAKVVKFAQTAMNYAAPCGDFSRTIIRQELSHDSDPVFRWQITNLRWAKNHTGLIMPDKLKSLDKIDLDAAAIMGYGRGTHPDNAKLLKPAPRLTVL